MPGERVGKDDPSWDRQVEALNKILVNLTKAVTLAQSVKNQISARALPYDQDVKEAHALARIAANELDTLGLMLFSMNGNRTNPRPRVVPPLPKGQGGPNWTALRVICQNQSYGDPNWYETDKLTEVEYAVEVRVNDDIVLSEKAATIEQAAGRLSVRLVTHRTARGLVSGRNPEWHAPAGLDRGVIMDRSCVYCGAKAEHGLLVHTGHCPVKRQPGERAGDEETAT